jgi:hypothetical protein
LTRAIRFERSTPTIPRPRNVCLDTSLSPNQSERLALTYRLFCHL